MKQPKIPRYVLTGGPCAGKTTALAMLLQKLSDFGVTPFLVSEVATHVIMNGIRFEKVENWPKLQQEIIRTQLLFEDIMERFANLQPGKRKILICDRGAMDGMAYTSPEEFKALVQDMDYRLIDLRDKRYAAVFHLVTAADGAEKFYNLENAARTETPEQARTLDKKTLGAWNGHEHLHIIGNRSKKEAKPADFKEKMETLLKEFCHTLGIPVPLEIERKFLLAPECIDQAYLSEGFRKWDIFYPVEVQIRQSYLEATDPNVERRVRERKQDGESLYTYTEKQEVRSGVRVERERIIPAREYIELLKQRYPDRADIRKRRYSFAYNGQYCQIDIVDSPVQLALFEIELTEENNTAAIPASVRVLKEVTDDSRYKNASIAAGTCPGYK